ncbi:MAG: bacterial Ig-like domain-containing protein, partial [Clostridia bacterium]|nr:bacterial Ig-like domain-containing protein [Clostridia bacterium]
MRKFLLTVLLSIVLVCVVTATATASHGFELNTSELSSVEAGQTVTVDVTVDNITVDGGIETLDFIVSYSDNLTYSKATAALPTGWEFWTPVSNTTDRTVKIGAVDEGATANPAINDGDITVTLTFVVASDFDSEKITLDFSNVGASANGSYEFVSGIGNSYEYYNAPETLTVTSLPIKTTYTAGQNFFSNGLKLSVTYTDGTVVEVTDFTVEAPDMMTEGVKDVVVKWGKLSTTFRITVNPPLL